MKGNPLLLLLPVLVALGAVLWPVCRLTLSPTESPSQAEQKKDPAPSSILPGTLILHAAPSPIRCSVSQHGKTLLTEANLIALGVYRASVEIGTGEDLVIFAEWTNDEPHAIRAEVRLQDYQIPLEKSFWAKRSLEDTFPIPDSPPR